LYHIKKKQMENFIILKRNLRSKKFGVEFPKNTKLGFLTMDCSIFAQHPNNENIYIRVSEKNIKERGTV
jgi:hypothetical protein